MKFVWICRKLSAGMASSTCGVKSPSVGLEILGQSFGGIPDSLVVCRTVTKSSCLSSPSGATTSSSTLESHHQVQARRWSYILQVKRRNNWVSSLIRIAWDCRGFAGERKSEPTSKSRQASRPSPSSSSVQPCLPRSMGAQWQISLSKLYRRR